MTSRLIAGTPRLTSGPWSLRESRTVRWSHSVTRPGCTVRKPARANASCAPVLGHSRA